MHVTEQKNIKMMIAHMLMTLPSFKNLLIYEYRSTCTYRRSVDRFNIRKCIVLGRRDDI